MEVVRTKEGVPGITGKVLVWRDRGTYYVGRPDKAVPTTFKFLRENYSQANGSPIDFDKVPQKWPSREEAKTP